MADLNALIAQGVQFKQPESPLNMMAQMQQLQQGQSVNQLNQMKMAEIQRSQDEANALRSLYARSAGKMENPDFLQQLAASSPSAYQAHLKFLGEQAKSKADIGLSEARTAEAGAGTAQKKQQLAKDQRDYVNQSLSELAFNPSAENIKAFGQDGVLKGLMTQEQADAKVEELLAMPVPQLKQYLSTRGLANKDTAELFQSKPVEKTDGQTKWMEESNPRLPTFGSRMVGTKPITMMPTPGEKLTAGTAAARLGFDERKLAWDRANPGYELKDDANGNLYAINKKTLESTPIMVGGAAAAAPVADAGVASAGGVPVGRAAAPAGVPFVGKAAGMTESQGAATNYGMRMQEAHQLLSDLEKTGKTDTGLIKGVVGGTVGLVPYLGDKLEGATGSVFNALPRILGGLSPEQQQTANARINFITAVLRKESGASISPGEFSTAEKLYFPQPGDDAKAIAQKQKARELSIKGMKVQAGPGAKNIGASGGAAPSANDPLGLR